VPIKAASPGTRITGSVAQVERKRHGISRAGGPEERQHQVGSASGTPRAERQAEVLPVPLQSHVGGDIDEAQQADGRVDRDAGGMHAGRLRLGLQDIVERGRDVGQVAEEVRDAGLHEARRDGVVSLRDGLDQDLVQGLVEPVAGSIEPLERILRIQRLARRQVRAAAQRDGQGDEE
jgi:hypothetical protein